VAIDHYENFPVASWACPAPLRPAVLAIYHFARTADDLADEGDAPPQQRLRGLAAYRQSLNEVLAGGPGGGRWSAVFGPLAQVLRTHALPGALLHALLDAFEQDVRNPPYPDRAALLDYCARSANPVGRLLLHLYRVGDALSLRQSDAICSALQLINFWQDLGVDLARGRAYVPAADLARHGLSAAALRPGADTPATRALVAELCGWAGALMTEGMPLALRLPGRIGWELRLVVAGGLRILEKIRAMEHASLSTRPTLRPADTFGLAWRALRMGPR
jgi:squalene synthase HpnC